MEKIERQKMTHGLEITLNFYCVILTLMVGGLRRGPFNFPQSSERSVSGARA